MNSVYSILKLLSDLKRNQFSGSLEVKLEAGKVALLQITESIGPEPENHRDNRGDFDVRAR
jgi:hypothetical protein